MGNTKKQLIVKSAAFFRAYLHKYSRGATTLHINRYKPD